MFPADRSQGVRIPEQQLRSGGTGQPSTVGSIVPLQLYAVQYYDEHGAEHRSVVYKMGDAVYFDLNAERWAAGLRQAAGYITKAVNAEYAVNMAPAAPGLDQVDVLAAEEVSANNTATSK